MVGPMEVSPDCGWALELHHLVLHRIEIELAGQLRQGAAFLSHSGHAVLLQESQCFSSGLAITIPQVFQDLVDHFFVHLPKHVLEVCHCYGGEGLCPIGPCR